MKQYVEKMLMFVPRPLPVGKTEFYDWSDRVIRLSGPFADADSMRFALASQILHLPSQAAYKSDRYFVKSMRKAAANQVAGSVFQDIKTKQQQAASQAAAAEATASTPNQTEATDTAKASNEQQ